MKRAKYTEPDDFFPKDIRKKAKIGEFNDEPDKNEKKENKERANTNKQFRDWVNGKEE